MLSALAVIAAVLLAPMAGVASAADPGLVSNVTGTTSSFYWWNGSTSNGNGQWVGHATFRNDWNRHQYLDIKVVKHRHNGTTTTENVNSFYVPANGTSDLAVWTNDLAASGTALTGILKVVVTVTKITTSNANWQPYSGNVSGPTATIWNPLGGAPDTTTTSTTTTTAVPTPDPGLATAITGVASNFYWWNGPETNGNGQWVGHATFRNDWIRHQYLDIKVVKHYSNGSQQTSTINSFYVPAGSTSDLAVWDNDLASNGSTSNLTGVLKVVVTVTKVTTSDVNWQPYSGNVSGPSATIWNPFGGGSGGTTTTVPGPGCGSYTPTQLAIDPTVVVAGSSVTVTGVTAPGDNVTATLIQNGTTQHVLGSALSLDDGQFSITGVVPESFPAGTYDIKVNSPVCPSGGTVSIVVTVPKMSGCGYNNEGRTFFPGQKVIWTLHESSFNMGQPIELRLNRKSGGTYNVNLYGPAYPGGSQVTFTIPLDAPISNKLEIEQIGKKKNSTTQTATKTCPVTVVEGPSPASVSLPNATAPTSGSTTLLSTVGIGLVATLTLARLRGRRSRPAA